MAERMAAALWNPEKRYPVGAGVYVIRCMTNKRFYIGSSGDVAVRLSRHFTLLRGGRHENPKLQNHFNKHGEEAFQCDLLELVGPDGSLDAAEQKWIDLYWRTGQLINIQRKAGRPPTFDELPPKVREEKREAHRRTSTGRPASERLRQLMRERVGASNPNYGTKLPPERVEAMRARMLGAGSPTFGKKGEMSALYGITRSAETKARMSDAQRTRAELRVGYTSSKQCKRVASDGTVTTYPSARAAARALGLALSSPHRWCTGLRHPSDGSKWEYIDEV